MARKKKEPEAAPAVETEPTAATAVLDPPAGEEAVQIDLPEDFPKAGLEVGTPEPTEEQVTEEPSAAPAPKMVRKEALDEERGKRKRLYQEVEQMRRRFDEEQRRRADDAADKPAASKDYNQMADLNELVTAVRSEIKEEFSRDLSKVRMESIQAKVTLSQEIMRSRVDEFDDVLAKAGVLEAVKIDPSTGKAKDPFLWNMIYLSENPALTAYEYAKGKLGEEDEASTTEIEERGAKRGRKEIVTKVIDNASKPRGIATMPSSTSSQTGLTRRQIDAMTDEQKAWIKKNRKEMWEWYLQG